MTTLREALAESKRWERPGLADGVHPADDSVRASRLDGDQGFMSIEGGRIVGHIGYREIEGMGFYGHSLTSWGSPAVAAALIKRSRTLARSLGHKSAHFHVKEPALAFLALVPRHATVVQAILRMKA